VLKLFQKPYNLFLPIAVGLFLIGLFNFSAPLEIHLHDTYYVLRLAHLFIVPATLLAVLWLIAYFTEKYMFSKILTWIHVLLSVAAAIFLIATVFSAYKEPAPLPETPKTTEAYLEYAKREAWSTAGAIIAFLFAQLIQLVNLILGLIKYVRSRQKETLGQP